MVDKFTEDEVENYRKIFSSMDKDGSGSISSKELSFALRKVGVSVNSEQLDEMMKEIDADSNGKMEFDEFLQIAARSTKDVDAEEELKEIKKISKTIAEILDLIIKEGKDKAMSIYN